MQNVNDLYFLNKSESIEILDDGLSVDSMIEGIDAFARITNATSFVIDFDKHEMIYESDKMLYLDYTTWGENRQRDCQNKYWSYVSEKTLDNFLLIKNNYPFVGQDINIEDYRTHICTIDYPIVVKKHEIFINQKFTPLAMRTDGIPKIGLFTINPSTFDHMESFIITQSKIRYRFDFKARKYKPFDLDRTLSITEKLILYRVQKGFSIEEIADALNLSVSTIKTHRMRLFKKLQVCSIAEALTVVSNYNLI